MAANGQLVFTDVDKVTFKGVGNTSNAVIDTITGKLGVGVDSPDANLHIIGNCFVSTDLTASTLSGNGSGLTALNATNITTGTLDAARIPVLDAAKITTGTLPVTRGGTGATGSSTGTGGVVLSVAPAFTGDVTFDTDTLKIDSTNNRVGIGSTLPRTNLHIGQQLNSQGDKDTIPSAGLGTSADFPSSTHAWFANRLGATGDEYWGLAVGTIYDGSSYLQNLNKDTSIYYNILLQPNGGNVGIGTDNPSGRLTIKGGGINIIDDSTPDSRAIVYYEDDGTTQIGFVGQGSSSNKDMYLYGRANSQVRIGAGNAERITVTTGGNVGIGTTSPRTGLHLSRDAVGTLANKYSSPGLTFTALNNSTTDMRGGSIWSQWGDPQYGLAFRGVSSGDTFPYLATPAMFVTSDKVGIGTITPYAKLHVVGNAGATAAGAHYGFKYNVAVGTFYTGSHNGISIYADNDIVAGEWVLSHAGTMGSSDERIKKEIVDVEDGEALSTIRLLKPKRYKYRDDVKRGIEPVWGFIAQEVADTIPYATQKRTECIPNIYETVNVSASNVITFTNFNTTNLESKTTSRLKLYDTKNTEHMVKITGILGEHSLQVEEDLTDWIGSFDESNTEGNEIFVYGEEVNDFHFLKKDAIWTVATAALQEVDRQLQVERSRNDTLEARILALESA